MKRSYAKFFAQAFLLFALANMQPHQLQSVTIKERVRGLVAHLKQAKEALKKKLASKFSRYKASRTKLVSTVSQVKKEQKTIRNYEKKLLTLANKIANNGKKVENFKYYGTAKNKFKKGWSIFTKAKTHLDESIKLSKGLPMDVASQDARRAFNVLQGRLDLVNLARKNYALSYTILESLITNAANAAHFLETKSTKEADRKRYNKQWQEFLEAEKKIKAHKAAIETVRNKITW